MDQTTLVTDHPQWKSRRVTLVCGPPGSGKSTMAAALHPRVIEVEDFADAETPREKLRRYGRAVKRVGRDLRPDVAVVRCAASVEERQHHESMCRPAKTIVVLVGADECHRRVDERGRPTSAGEHLAVDEWWRVWDAEH